MSPRRPHGISGRGSSSLWGSRYLLVEFGFEAPFSFAQRMLEGISAAGVVPVVAHPERYRFAQEDRGCLLRWIEAGWALQINKGSLFGRFGRRAARTAHWCLGEGCMHLIGSDAHSPYRRTPWLEDARSYVAEYTAPEIADFLLEENPRRMLENAPIRPVLAQF